MKGKFVVGASLPRVDASGTHGRRYVRYWGRSASERADEKIRAAYAAETGRDPDKRFTEGLGKAQWEYGCVKTPYYTKHAREGVLVAMGVL